MYYNTAMNKIKSPSVAGSFYTANKDELEKQLEYFENASINQYEYKSRAVIVPHAGLVYSGGLAYSGLQSLDKDLKTLIIFAPSHHVAFDGWFCLRMMRGKPLLEKLKLIRI